MKRRDLPRVPLEDALKLVHLYAGKESPKFEKAAMHCLERYLAEGSPSLRAFAQATRVLAEREQWPKA